MKAITNNLKRALDSLCQSAITAGAEKVISFPASQVVIDERVRMKCLVPTCSFYGNSLLCPPNLISVEHFKNIVNLYEAAILIRIPGSSTPVPSEVTNAASLDDLWEKIYPAKRKQEESNPAVSYFNELKASQERLYDILSVIESNSLKAGYRFSMGFAAGGCLLCDQCVGPNSNEPCRHPFRARPSMEAMGIDVVGTAEKVGVPVGFSSVQSHWFGLVLLE